MEKLTPNVIILKDGPIMIEGKLSIVDSDDLVYQPEKCFLCRCGGSNKKPFCDGTHKKINFKDGKERKYPYFKEGEKVRCKKTTEGEISYFIDGKSYPSGGDDLIAGEIYEVVRPQCTPYGILVKNVSGKEIWAERHSNFEWID